METEDDLRRFLKQKLRECFNIHYSNSSRATSWNDTATCPWVFDGYLCWPDTEAGTTISQNCPDFVEGFQHTNLAHKTCLGNGTWFRHPESDREWSNYTNCVDHEELIFRSSINTWYIRGYITSLVTLIVSLIIFMSFKTLWCTRIKIHIQLFISLSFTCIVWIIWYKFIVQNPDTIFEYPKLCVIWHIVIYYFMLSNYFWVFCEGLHLHLALVVVFVKDTIAIRWFLVIGWIFPLFYVGFYASFLFYFTTGHP
uniref:G-protein coupled receptors family 2 profile 2 domain-containing protein n=1 Tax=Megaselia scalaris TaxID=36166 RepID=T1GN21_MEGSC